MFLNTHFPSVSPFFFDVFTYCMALSFRATVDCRQWKYSRVNDRHSLFFNVRYDKKWMVNSDTEQDCYNTVIVAFRVFLVLKTDSVVSIVFCILMWTISISIRAKGCIQFQTRAFCHPHPNYPKYLALNNVDYINFNCCETSGFISVHLKKIFLPK